MLLLMRLIVCLVYIVTVIRAETRESYMRRRQQFNTTNNDFRYGEAIHLNPREEIIEQRLLAFKRDEFQRGMATEHIAPGENFMKVIKTIDASNVFQMIKRMPKGAALHIHLTAMIDPSWLVATATYRDDCYVCVKSTGGFAFRISANKPIDGYKNCRNWRRVVDVRNQSHSAAAFDESMSLNMTILTEQPSIDYPNINDVWRKAGTTWPALADLAYHKDILPGFFTEVMRQYLADGVQYFEARGSLYGMYDENNKTHTAEECLLVLREAVRKFKQSNPNFIGAKFITEKSKYSTKDKIQQAVVDAVYLHEKYPDFLAGFDLVAQEDPTHPIIYYLDGLLAPSQMQPPYKLPYFFHAGETTWEGTHIDANLYDALLLNASRIGHGYAAIKHRLVLEKLKENDVPVEVNPVSNQVLLLVDDLRNHPAAYLLAHNYSIVVSSDDPGLWGALPLSHDFYEIFMGCMPMTQGLRPLKRLAMDSIRYSVMSETEKAEALTKWMRQWNKFILEEIFFHSAASPA